MVKPNKGNKTKKRSKHTNNAKNTNITINTGNLSRNTKYNIEEYLKTLDEYDMDAYYKYLKSYNKSLKRYEFNRKNRPKTMTANKMYKQTTKYNSQNSLYSGNDIYSISLSPNRRPLPPLPLEYFKIKKPEIKYNKTYNDIEEE